MLNNSLTADVTQATSYQVDYVYQFIIIIRWSPYDINPKGFTRYFGTQRN